MFEDVCQDLMTCFSLALQLRISFGHPGHPGPGLLAVLAVTTEDIPRWGTSLLSMLMDLVPWILREARDQFDNRAGTCRCVTRDLRGLQTLLPFTQRGKMPA